MKFKPMLAHKLKESKLVFPCFAQPKLNGVRGVWLRDHMLSRGRPKEDGISWHHQKLPQIHEELHALQQHLSIGLPLDGELYCHGMSLQQINSRVAVKSVTPHKQVDDIKYYIFDIIRDRPFEQRERGLTSLRRTIRKLNFPHLCIVESQKISDMAELSMYHKLNLQRGFEGTMYREAGAVYGLLQNCSNQENRWNCLLKWKNSLDLDCEIVEVIEGREGKTGQFLGKAGALKLVTPDGKQFNAGSGLIVTHRSMLWNLRNEIVGVTCRVEFDEYSDDMIPVRPRIVMINDERFE